MNTAQKNNFIKHNDITICYETHGNPNDPSIILIMGIDGQLISWPSRFVQGLVSRVIIFDNRDAGLSSYYDHLTTPNIFDAITAKQQGKSFNPPYTLHDMAADIVVLLNKLNIKKTHIVGASMGGMIAQVFTLDYPERVLSLTIIASTSGEPNLPPAKPEVLNFFFAPKKLINDLESYIKDKMTLYKIYNHPSHVDEVYVREFYTKTYQRAYHPTGFARQLLAMMFAEPRTDKLKKLRIPSLVIHGDCDPVFPIEHGRQLAECLLNSHLEIIENLGHGLPDSLCNRMVNLIATMK